MSDEEITAEVAADLAPLVGHQLAGRIVSEADTAGVSDAELRRIVADVRAAADMPAT